MKNYQHWNFILFDLLLEKPQLSFHLVTTPDLIDELALECVRVWVQVAELDKAKFAQLRYTGISRFRLKQKNLICLTST